MEVSFNLISLNVGFVVNYFEVEYEIDIQYQSV